jgi:hypothetical protein
MQIPDVSVGRHDAEFRNVPLLISIREGSSEALMFEPLLDPTSRIRQRRFCVSSRPVENLPQSAEERSQHVNRIDF